MGAGQEFREIRIKSASRRLRASAVDLRSRPPLTLPSPRSTGARETRITITTTKRIKRKIQIKSRKPETGVSDQPKAG